MLSVDVEKRLPGFTLEVRFDAGDELIVLFGHSGAGKSLTLQAIAGTMRPDRGRIAFDGETVFDAATRIDRPPQARRVGYVVQHYALFPHLTVAQNIAFGLAAWPRPAARQRVAELVATFHLEGLEQRYPHQVSGGQQQRVALARALAPRPRLLLLDEPFAALDSALRASLRRELAALKGQLGMTIVFVTHDLREGYGLADRLAVYDAGRVLQVGPRDEVYHHPASRRAAELLEVRNILRGRVAERDGDGLLVRTPRFDVRTPAYAFEPGEAVDICIRPEQVLLLRPDRSSPERADTVLDGTIVDEYAQGSSHTLFFRVDGPADAESPPYDLEVEVPSHPYEVMGVAHQRRWAVALRRSAVHVMAAEGAVPSPSTGEG